MIGELDQRATLFARTLTPDGAGGFTDDWSAFATVWIALAPMSVAESVDADRLESRVRHRITLRRRGDLAAGQRIVANGRTFRVFGILDEGPRSAYVTLQCEELS